MNTPLLIAVVTLCVLALSVVLLFFKQLKGFFALILNTCLGWAGLYIFNLLFAGVGFSIGINLASASIVGVLGLPGLLLMIILKFIYK